MATSSGHANSADSSVAASHRVLASSVSVWSACFTRVPILAMAVA